jgi:hypothetical protein
LIEININCAFPLHDRRTSSNDGLLEATLIQ